METELGFFFWSFMPQLNVLVWDKGQAQLKGFFTSERIEGRKKEAENILK